MSQFHSLSLHLIMHLALFGLPQQLLPCGPGYSGYTGLSDSVLGLPPEKLRIAGLKQRPRGQR